MVDHINPLENQPDPSNLGTLIITGFTGNVRIVIRRISENPTIEIVSTRRSGTQSMLDIAFPRGLPPHEALSDLVLGLDEFDVLVQGTKSGAIPVLVVSLSATKTPRQRLFRRTAQPPRTPRTQDTKPTEAKPEVLSAQVSHIPPPTPPEPLPEPEGPKFLETLAEKLHKVEMASNALTVIGRGWEIFALILAVTMPALKLRVSRFSRNLANQTINLSSNTQNNVSMRSNRITKRASILISWITAVTTIIVDGIFGSNLDDKPEQ